MVSQVIDEVVEGQSKSQKLSEIIDDVEDCINEILIYIQEEELELLEGNSNDFIPDKIQLNEEDVAMLLESRYNIGEIEELQYEEAHPDDVEVFVDDEVNDGGVDAGKEVVVEGVDEGQEEDDGVSNLLVCRKRKPSDRILKLKLKKIVYDKDGSGSSATKHVKLD
ncbi:unnamed protein product [Lactuca virosa]|uniref:Uncharacterized protein n=1 Tax=Lactuca virosa TaxID=75947 RepID=A0AAU9M5S4_9ASTR|nr:unnamed protein product [Lactuca virosa]